MVKIIVAVIVGILVLGIAVIAGTGMYIWKSIPSDIKILYQASELSSQGKYEEVVKLYDDLLKDKPDSIIAWNGKGEALHNLGKYEEAIAAYDKGISCGEHKKSSGST